MMSLFLNREGMMRDKNQVNSLGFWLIAATPTTEVEII